MLPRHIALVQAIYYGITGIWPLFSMRTFLKVTGPKTDLWLVRCVGLLITISAAVLIYTAYSPVIPTEIKILAIGEAASLTILEVYYVFRRTISPIYLVDAVIEILLILGWTTIS